MRGLDWHTGRRPWERQFLTRLGRGEHIRTEEEHPARVLIAGMQSVGVDVDELGEVQGALSALAR